MEYVIEEDIFLMLIDCMVRCGSGCWVDRWGERG